MPSSSEVMSPQIGITLLSSDDFSFLIVSNSFMERKIKISVIINSITWFNESVFGIPVSLAVRLGERSLLDHASAGSAGRYSGCPDTIAGVFRQAPGKKCNILKYIYFFLILLTKKLTFPIKPVPPVIKILRPV